MTCKYAGCSGLTSIGIPNSVTNIGNAAFNQCSRLTDVYCYAKTLPSTDYYNFFGNPVSNATLHVPASAIEEYKNTYPWSYFGNIVALSGMGTSVINNLTKTSANGERSIYTFSGQRLNRPMRGLNIIEGKKVIVK